MEPKIRIEKIEMVSIKDITLDPENTNEHPKEQIEAMAKQYAYQGVRTPIIVSNQTKYVKAGELRFLAAKLAGLKFVPVSFQDFDDEDQEIAFGIADNAIPKQSKINFMKVNSQIEKLDPNFDIEMLGIQGFTIDPSDKEDLKPQKQLKEHTCPGCGLVFAE